MLHARAVACRLEARPIDSCRACAVSGRSRIEERGWHEGGNALPLVVVQQAGGRHAVDGRGDDERGGLQLVDRVDVARDDGVDERVVEAVRRGDDNVQARLVVGKAGISAIGAAALEALEARPMARWVLRGVWERP